MRCFVLRLTTRRGWVAGRETMRGWFARRATRRGRVAERAVVRGRESEEGHRFGAIGKCLLCGFELGDDGSGLPRTGSHTQRTCGMKSPPCRHKLPAQHPFAKEGACFALACCCTAKCSKCNRVGHRVDTMVMSPDRFQMDPKTGNVTRRRLAPPLSRSEFFVQRCDRHNCRRVAARALCGMLEGVVGYTAVRFGGGRAGRQTPRRRS